MKRAAKEKTPSTQPREFYEGVVYGVGQEARIAAERLAEILNDLGGGTPSGAAAGRLAEAAGAAGRLSNWLAGWAHHLARMQEQGEAPPR